jgi:outer membrane protein insertion porin family
VLGSNTLHGLSVRLTHDTRDNQFLATEGYLLDMGFEQVLGSFQYPRGDVDLRKYFLIRQHPDGSGRHVLSLGGRMAITGDDTPIYEHYFLGGFTTLRGFSFREASPRDPNYHVVVGGKFSVMATAEYMVPITADDMLRGVVFCDSGVAQPSINDWSDRYRAAVGFGLRITIPAMGPAPIALDFAFPVSKEKFDQTQVFSFFIGFLR